jgi:hypothetical protein
MTHQPHVTPGWRTARMAGIAGASLTLIAAVVAVPAAAAPSQAASSPSAGSQQGAARISRGTLHFAGRTSPARAASSQAKSRGVHRMLPVLRAHPTATAKKAQGPAGLAGQRLAARGLSRVVQSFDGVDAVKNGHVAFDLEPPDEGLGAGHGWVVNFVNLTGAVYTHSGRQLGKAFYLNRFFREPDAANTSDPRVFYDHASHRWFATILEYTFNANFTRITESHVDVAVSRTANPHRAWNVYQIPTSHRSHTDCPCLADYPILGVDAANIYITTDEFTKGLDNFNGSQMYAVSKKQLIGGRLHPNYVSFENLSAGGVLGYRVHPANVYGKAPAEFMLSTLDPNGTFDNRLAVWAVTNESAVTTGRGKPGLSVRIIKSEAYSPPPTAVTPPGFCSACGRNGEPTTGLVDTGPDAMYEVQYMNGRLVGAAATGVTVAGDTDQRSGAAWFVVRPRVTGAAVSSTTRVKRQGYVSMHGEYLFFPHINMTEDGAMAMALGLGGPSTYLSAAYAVAAPGRGFRTVHLVAPGTGPNNGFAGTEQYGGVNRWGDYSNGEIVPGTNRIWFATQYIPNRGDGNVNWGNRIFELKLR